jgi:DNA-3-methyladenine glycosylase II
MEKTVRIIRDRSDINEGLAELVIADPRLVPIIELSGELPLRLIEPGFAGLASIIVSQVVSRASADAIWKRMAAVRATEAEAFAALDPEVVASFGLSRAKAATLTHLATAIAEKGFDLDAIAGLEASEATRQLIALPGIGPWTAECYMMFSAGHADFFPVGDVALQAAVADGLGMEARPTEKQLAAIALIWRPWRSVATRLFWSYYGVRTKRDVSPIL